VSDWPEGYALQHFEEIDSTNEEARRVAANGGKGPLWITADRQTAGRGRRGRTWQSPLGNLAATLLIDPGKPAAECAQLSFVAALAASDMIASAAPRVDIRVKWPNDVLAEGRKIAGILLESASTGAAPPQWLAIGIGINLKHFPPDTEFPATSLVAIGAAPPMPREALAALASAFAKWYEVWAMRGFAPIREAWLARAAGLGARIVARLSNGEATGVFEGLDETGALILREAHGRTRVIAAGEIFFAS
ncbi:MAG TPA: biotin--[acetyl-CoA-carboxylase] ligase, partial [Rhizomicrobium sp.]|jgi:BirA family biotin operon repressor/biotin-[acetyl-CoA-carboxylase] ligase|nr:biotin--[acetyl-CoA-carboxylase] ligase [Rhizomicrobium sp.]